MFELCSPFLPKGDQPAAIDKLVTGVKSGKNAQVLLGITGSGKTFTMANVIAQTQKPTLIIAHNKTLAAQLYQEFQSFFPANAVEYFVSYYDYYQPEAYIARTDTYIEKDFAINDKIDKMRLSATRSLLERRDVIIVASVSCIYGLGTPEYYKNMTLLLKMGKKVRRDDVLLHLVDMQYQRNDTDFFRKCFRVRGDVLDIFPAYEEDVAYRVEFFGDDIERICEFDPLTGQMRRKLDEICIYPSSHHVTPEEVRHSAIETIKSELEERVEFFKKADKLIEAQRIKERTMYDIEMIKEVGFCKGIENYSRHFSRREVGSPPPCLIDYFPDDFLLFVDESHQTLPQVRAMFAGDKSRKQSLVDFGWRLPSAYDNRPLQFEEFYKEINQVIYVSATPTEFEVRESFGEVVEQIIRPTGLLDPLIDIRPVDTQVDDCLAEIAKETKKGGRVLVTTLTKRLSEELTGYLTDLGIKARYLHSEVETLERLKIIHELRAGTFDVLVGINLLREGLDIPEVSLVAILDADKEGFLRSETSLIQTCGRAARNAEGRVVMYADKETFAIKSAIATTLRRRKIQEEYNQTHNITPKTVKRDLALLSVLQEGLDVTELPPGQKRAEKEPLSSIDDVRKKIAAWDKAMRKAAKDLRFEDAAHARDMLRMYQEMELTLS
jgi:excinuclease ABC subunit B